MRRILLWSLLGLSSFLVSGCQALYEAKRPYKVYAKPAAFFNPLVNTADTKADTGEIKLENSDYPIEITLFKDRSFRYYLARLGDGVGTWTYENGHIKLYAERQLFVMQMEMHSTAPEDDAAAIALEFSDRFGPKFLPLVKK